MAKDRKKQSNRPKKDAQVRNVRNAAEDVRKWRLTNAELRDLLKVTGGLDRVNELLSSAYLLQSYANGFVEDCNRLLEYYGMKGGALGLLFRKAQRSNDDYFDAFYKLICETDEESLINTKEGIFKDMEVLDRMFYKSFPFKREKWEPDLVTLDRDIRAIEKKYGLIITRKHEKAEGSEG